MQTTPGLVRVRQAYLYDGYWEDIGTIKSFYESNLALTDSKPNFRCVCARPSSWLRPLSTC